MSLLKSTIPKFPDGSVDYQTWLEQFEERTGRKVSDIVREAVMIASHTGQDYATHYGVPCLRIGLEMADILTTFNMDDDGIAAAILYSSVQFAGLDLSDVSEQLSDKVARIIEGTHRMDAIEISHGRLKQSTQLSASMDNLRKMLLAMVDDVRVVLVKLAERATTLRHASPLSDNIRKKLAQETIDIFAPLANRLGVAQIKWLLEDYAFRYLNPEKYIEISKSLKQRRLDREYYVEKMVSQIQDCVESVGVKKFEVYGRAKHIYSIYKKMFRKNLPVDEIFDIIAIRVLVPTIEDCYAVLGEVQNKWQPIKKEFDDYIAHPKPNGYQSIHTAVIGPDDRFFEVQIRTFDMHSVAELGVAAHWMYKEGRTQKSSYEAKIDWLRNLMEWQQELSESDRSDGEALVNIFQDRVYIFTPRGDVLDLPQGATCLDFAYHIHSEIGNRCRGAKVNDKLVPLNYVLQMGDLVEVVTDKNGKPSRDWLNQHQGYLVTSKAKAKVLHYFRQLDFERHVAEGEELFNKEAKRLHLNPKIHPDLLTRLNLRTKDDLYAAIGRGDLGAVTVLNALQNRESEQSIESEPELRIKPKIPHKRIKKSNLSIAGVDNLLTKIAGCCQPVPGDEVIGYVTLGSGVSIHRQDCNNMSSQARIDQDRIVQVSWGEESEQHYVVDLRVIAQHRSDLMKDISSLLSSENISMLGLTCAVDKAEQLAHISISVEVDGLHPLSQVISKLKQLPSVMDVRRQN